MTNHISIAIGADHAGFDYKSMLIDYLKEYSIKDFGTYGTSGCQCC